MAILKTTTSVCSGCLTKVPAEVFEEDGAVYLEKVCAKHGKERALLASDVNLYFQSGPAAKGGCSDSGCSFFDNHSCTLMFEITDRCNLTCPTCFTGSSPQHTFQMSLQAFDEQLSRLMSRGKHTADLIQLSGGEPTVHPELEQFIELALKRGVRKIYLNTNGVRLGKDPEFAKRLGRYADALQIYLQFDGLKHEVHDAIRGAKGLGTLKESAVRNCIASGLFVMPVMTVTRGINLDEIGAMVSYVRSHHPHMNTLMLQPAMYAGRYLNTRFFQRVTTSELIHEVARQSDGLFDVADFGPIPCSDPNCFAIAIAMVSNQREGKSVYTPISRHFPPYESWSRPEMAERIAGFSNKLPMNLLEHLGDDALVDELLDLVENADDGQVFNKIENFFCVAIKPFMDANSFDQHRADKCCTHVIDREGNPVSLCEYNAIRRPQDML